MDARREIEAAVERLEQVFATRSLDGERRVGLWDVLRFRARHGYLPLMMRRPGWRVVTRVYEGRPGAGKTLSLTADAIRAMRRGVLVAANYALWDPVTGERALMLRSWTDVLVWTVLCRRAGVPMLVAIDELGTYADARVWQRTPSWWLAYLQQHRHLGVGISGTAQSLRQVDSRVRLLVAALVQVSDASLTIGRRVVVPVQRWREIDPGSVESEEYREVAAGVWLVPWFAYAGYSTEYLVPVQDWSAEKEDAEYRAALWSVMVDIAAEIETPSVAGEAAWIAELEAWRERVGDAPAARRDAL